MTAAGVVFRRGCCGDADAAIGRLKQADELLIEAPHGLRIDPAVKPRAKRPDPPLSENGAGLDGSHIGLAGEPACLVSAAVSLPSCR
jgi:hypothetical protein